MLFVEIEVLKEGSVSVAGQGDDEENMKETLSLYRRQMEIRDFIVNTNSIYSPPVPESTITRRSRVQLEKVFAPQFRTHSHRNTSSNVYLTIDPNIYAQYLVACIDNYGPNINHGC